MWPDELDAFDLEAADFMSEDFMAEALAEDELLDDSAELAEALLEVLNDDYADASTEEAEEVLSDILETMPLAEAFNFTQLLRQIAEKGLPLAGGAAGTFLGGPVGMAFGSKAGQMAGRAFAGTKAVGSRGAVAKPASPTRGSAAPLAKASPATDPGAAKKIVEVMPVVLKALAALSLGPEGKKSIKVSPDGPSVLPSAIVSMLGALASQAAAEADELLGESDEASAYLRDSEGQYLVDPAAPAERAEALYRVLSDAENQRLDTEMAIYSTYWNSPDGIAPDDEEWDAFEEIR